MEANHTVSVIGFFKENPILKKKNEVIIFKIVAIPVNTDARVGGMVCKEEGERPRSCGV